MTVEEKNRLEELRNQEELTEEEDGEMQRLVALEKEMGTTPPIETTSQEDSGDEIDTQG